MNRERWGREFDGLMWGVVFAVVLAHGYLATASVNTLLNWYHYDDAFYYFKTAQNFAQGLGMTFDGTGTTNGFHPLWMAVCVPVFALARGVGDVLPLRVLVVIVGVLVAASAWGIYRTGKRLWGAEAALPVAALWALWPTSYLAVSAGGMETSLNAVTLVFFWYAWVQAWSQPEALRGVRRLGWAAALVMLARLDNALIVAVVGLVLLWRWWRAGFRGVRLARLAWAFGFPGFLGMGAFLTWSRVTVGTWMPISSQVKMWWGAMLDTPYGRAWRYRLLGALDTWLHTPPSAWGSTWSRYWAKHHFNLLFVPASVLAVPFILWGVFVWARRHRRTAIRLARHPLAVWTLAVFLHGFYLQVLSGIAPLRTWYWTPERLTVALWTMWALHHIIRFVRAWPVARWLAAAVAVGMLVSFGAWWVKSFPWYNSHQHLYLHQAQWLEQHTQPGDVIAVPGAGALGYFVHDRTIFNLDGLIGTPAYLEACQEGHIVTYLQAHDVRYVYAEFWVKNMLPYRDTLSPHLVTGPMDEYDGALMALFDFRP